MSASASLKDLMARDELAVTALRRAKAELSQSRHTLGHVIAQRALALHSMLESTGDFDEDDYLDLGKLHTGLRLEGWEVEHEHLRATFVGDRCGGYEVEVRVPDWLLSDDWQLRLNEKRAARAALLERLALAEAAQVEARERALLAELKQKYGTA